MEAKRTIGLLTLVVAVLMALTAALAASDADAEKNKKKKKPNKVLCVKQGTVCNGTQRNDLLVGTSAQEILQGGEGKDIYDGKNGEDTWVDKSVTSNDTYLVGKAFQAQAIGGKFEPFDVVDFGGSSDTIDFGPFSSDDLIEVTDNAFGSNLGIRVLIKEEPQRTGVVIIPGHLEDEEQKVENFKFSDRTLTAQEIEDLIPQP
jgi:hypothetical protein